MDGEFDRRLAEANARGKNSRDQADAENARKRAEWEQRVAKVNAASDEWRVRIEPAIRKAIDRANIGINQSGVQLSTKNDVARTTAPGRSPALPPQASLLVFGRADQLGPSLKIGIDSNGMASITSSLKGAVTASNDPVETSALTDEKIQSAVADFVDALIP
jgi:hypothetical protein